MCETSRRDSAPPALSPVSTAVPPRLLSKAQAAQYLGLTPRGFDRWRKDGRIPNALPGTSRWDRTAIDASIDALSQLGGMRAAPMPPQPEVDPLEEWRKKRDERRNRRG